MTPCVRNLPSWQDLHVAVVTTAWFIVTAVAQLACERWQESHFAVPAGTGMCVPTLALLVALPPTPWQVSHAPVPTAFDALWAKVTMSQFDVDLWQDSQFPVTLAWVVPAGFFWPSKYGVVWQVTHCALTATLLCNFTPVQSVNPLWQVSHLAPLVALTSWNGV